MRRLVLFTFAFIALYATQSISAPLKIVQVSAPEINCVFDSACGSIVVTDSSSPLPLRGNKTAFLQTRTYQGKAGSPAEGVYAYVYRIDLSKATVFPSLTACYSSLKIPFSRPVTTLDYNNDGTTDEVYVITKGGIGTIAPVAAEKDLNGNVTFTFAKPVCAGKLSKLKGRSKGESTFFFGMTSKQPPVMASAVLTGKSSNSQMVAVRAPRQTDLVSAFYADDACAAQILAGTPYNMNDTAWKVNGRQNKDICAYKFFSGLMMLGFNTEAGMYDQPQVKTLNNFQAAYGFPMGENITIDELKTMDSLLLRKEDQIAAVAREFPLYDHMQPLHKNDVSKDFLAYIYTLPMKVLPQSFQMNAYETAQCIWGQCLGDLQDINGQRLPCQQAGCYTADTSSYYGFAGAYFDRLLPNSRRPSAAVDVQTVLHEFAHYVDGQINSTWQGLPHLRMLDTSGFNSISYDLSTLQGTCAVRRSNDPKDFISRYGFLSDYGCPPGKAQTSEEFAEAFSIYVTAGKNFRQAATQNATIARKYEWLKTNVFQGVEYNTDLQNSAQTGCNDIPGAQQAQPAYVSCSESYVWDGTLQRL